MPAERPKLPVFFYRMRGRRTGTRLAESAPRCRAARDRVWPRPRAEAI